LPLRKKLLTAMTLFILGLSLSVYIPLRIALVGQIARLERENLNRGLNLTCREVHSATTGLDSLARQAAGMPEISRLLSPRTNTLSPRTGQYLSEYGADILIITDSHGKPVWFQNLDTSRSNLALDDEFLLGLRNAPIMNPGDESPARVISLDQVPVIVTAMAISHLEDDRTITGRLVLGKFLDSRWLEATAALAQASLAILSTGDLEGMDHILAQPAGAEEGPAYILETEGHPVGFIAVLGVDNSPSLVVKVEGAGVGGQAARRMSLLLMALVAGLALASWMGGRALLDRLLFSRLNRLTSGITAVEAAGDSPPSVWVPGDDELSEMARSLNSLLQTQRDSLAVLQKSEERYRKLFDEALSGNYICSPDGKVILCNAVFAQMMGLETVEKAIGYNFISLFPNRIDGYEFIRQVRDKKKLQFFECNLVRPDGQEIIVLQNVVGIFDQNAELVHLQGYMFDVTESRKAQIVARKLELEKAISTISSRFVGASNIDDALKMSLGDIGQLTGASRAHLVLLNDGGNGDGNGNLEWRADGKAPSKKNGDAKRQVFDLWGDRLNSGEIVHVTRDPGTDDGELLQTQGLDSLLLVPIVTGGRLAGFMNFDNVQESGRWGVDDGALLRISSAVLGTALERRQAEERIRYLIHHDDLTGLCNRTSFDEELLRLDTSRYLPLTVIMGDLNGLKVVNDAFGHEEGDKLLVKIAHILKSACRKDDTIARWGGDEFIILLPKADQRDAAEVCKRIRAACEKTRVGPIQLSIALGIATKEHPKQDIKEVLREAEERMYRNKLMERSSAKHAIISSLAQSLWETDYETEEHARRLQKWVIQLGRRLRFPENQLDDLALLGALHDIGKIAIQKGTLLKPGKLTEEEWEEIKKHPEIGYRIAGSCRDLAPIAEAILSHHERWDGHGYPQGLKGENIPQLSRIIAVIDAYDVMLTGRPYKKAVPKDAAIEELLRCSGSQFDPELVEAFTKMVTE